MNTTCEAVGLNEQIKAARNSTVLETLALDRQPGASQKTLRKRARLLKQKRKEFGSV
jgi:hypothetical protein